MIRLAPAAVADLAGTLDHIANDSTAAAETLRVQVFERLASLERRDFEGAQTMLRSGLRVRRWYVHPFWIYYRRHETGIDVLRVYHHAREPIGR